MRVTLKGVLLLSAQGYSYSVLLFGFRGFH